MNIMDLLKHAAEAIDTAGRAAVGFVEDHVEVEFTSSGDRHRIVSVTHDGDNLVLVVE